MHPRDSGQAADGPIRRLAATRPHHPRQLAALQVQRRADIGQRHVHHRHVQDEHQLRGRKQRQGYPA
jgi:hypothetical protein